MEIREDLTDLQNSMPGKITLKGHTESTNTEAYKLAFSLRRAQAVMVWLIEHGLDASRPEAKDSGEFRPIADNGTEEGRALNRLVEITLQ